jgi:hypothetical protein
MIAPVPVVLGNAILSNGDLAVLAGNQTSSGGSLGFDQLQVAILTNSTPADLNQTTGLAFPFLGSPDNGFHNPDLGGGTIAALPGGGMAIETWGGPDTNYYLQILDNTGAVTTPPFVIQNQATNGGSQDNPIGAVAAWSSGIVTAYSTNDGQVLTYQRYTVAGVAVGSPVAVASNPAGTGWTGSMSVDSLGDVVFGFASGNPQVKSTYAEFNAADVEEVSSGTVDQLSSAPKFAPLQGGGFITAGYVNDGAFTGGLATFDLTIQTVSSVGVLSAVDTAVVDAAGPLTQASIGWVDTTVDGNVEFLENGNTTAADIYDVGSTALMQNAVPLPSLAFAVSPVASLVVASVAGVGINASNELVGEDIGCLVTGAEVATVNGPRPVEELRAGDLVLTASGEARPVRWIGHRSIDIGRHPQPEAVRPLRIATGSFGPGIPRRDLLVSPDHGIRIDGVDDGRSVLVPAARLADGRCIASVDVETVTYWHVELDTHDVILAEGLPVESYLDDGRRGNFSNGDDPLRLHADFSPPITNAQRWEVGGCLRLVITGPVLEAARLLVGRAGSPYPAGEPSPETRVFASRQKAAAEGMGGHCNVSFGAAV